MGKKPIISLVNPSCPNFVLNVVSLQYEFKPPNQHHIRPHT